VVGAGSLCGRCSVVGALIGFCGRCSVVGALIGFCALCSVVGALIEFCGRCSVVGALVMIGTSTNQCIKNVNLGWHQCA